MFLDRGWTLPTPYARIWGTAALLTRSRAIFLEDDVDVNGREG